MFDNPLEIARSQTAVASQMSAQPGGTALLPVLLAASRDSLANGMHLIFVAGGAVMALTLLLTLFLPEVPLRSKAHASE